MHEHSSELVIRLKRGDDTAFEEIFERYKVKAVRTAYLITGNKDMAEDIVQEAFIESYKGIAKLREPKYFETWFFKILTHISWKSMKKERTLVPVENVFEIDSFKSFQEARIDFIKDKNGSDLSDAIEGLEIKQKTAILLYYYGGFSVSEIAKIMGCFEGTVKSRLYTARKNLKNSLKHSKKLVREDMNDAIAYKI